ncbi:MAG: hydroxyacid dehydrogenase [Lentisphaeria bacterium]|jgi:phosphoglycerate dehydrogenase-like enzyme|nr:hydroxyacid dehydrogenase [Lentisphaeria bacterium]
MCRDLFFTCQPGIVHGELWSPYCQQRAADLGLNVRMNPKTGRLASEEWADLLAEEEAVITTWGAPRFDAAVLAKNSRLRFVGHAAGSVANLVSDELYERGVRVVTANAIMARSVAEWCLTATMLAARGFLDYAKFGGSEPPKPDSRDAIAGLADLTIGIWGFGDVVRVLLDMLAPLEAGRILVCDDYLSPEEAERRGVRKVDLATLARESDILHTLTGLTHETKGALDQAHLARLRDGATVVNAGRAPLVEREAFLAELQSGRLRAILDVHYQEPPPAGDAFVVLPNVIMTAHCAGRGSRGRYVACILEEYDRFRRGEPLRHEISRERARHMTNADLVKG